MARRIALLLVLALLALPAALAEQPQTRLETIVLEGMEEQITTQLYVSPGGRYSIWLDPEVLAPLPPEEGDDRELFMPPDAGEDSSFQLSIRYREGVTEAEAAEATRAEINDAFGKCEQLDVEQGGDPVFDGYPYSAYFAESGDQATLHYLVPDVDGTYCIAINFPLEAAEGSGMRAEQMLRSFLMLRPD